MSAVVIPLHTAIVYVAPPGREAGDIDWTVWREAAGKTEPTYCGAYPTEIAASRAARDLAARHAARLIESQGGAA